ncbi:MAG: dCMP deaminase family protein [Patescibacteria group bacterium]
MVAKAKFKKQNHQTPTIPDWDKYFMSIAQVVKTRGNCLLKQVGVVLVKDKRIIATGYNGTPAGVKNCLDGGCLRCSLKNKGKLKSGEQKGTCLCVHAEVNSVIQSAYWGTSTKGSKLYTTLHPCMLCAKELINAGVEELYYMEEDNGEKESLALLRKSLNRVKRITLKP